ncbi:hypothetical protein LTR56_018214 [Elasticomyces elasticus]|nr:hypothetical protein LTR22_025533 [Elasticomyces elasticus]KAK3629204.1 hypothetical protein LTR56_018214 [Elasticomyces elasticus]KAK4905715.1 hypothetical protein LTR49_025015 [Elasticomyces elasticus]KAK5764482.1 hypothetical protein LTS12_005458 [Elasticomyces elasticus]
MDIDVSDEKASIELAEDKYRYQRTRQSLQAHPVPPAAPAPTPREIVEKMLEQTRSFDEASTHMIMIMQALSRLDNVSYTTLMDLTQDKRTLRLTLCQLAYALVAALTVERRVTLRDVSGQWDCFEAVDPTDKEAQERIAKWINFTDPRSGQVRATLGNAAAGVLATLILACFDDTRRVGSERPGIKQEDETKQDGKVERQDETKQEGKVERQDEIKREYEIKQEEL